MSISDPTSSGDLISRRHFEDFSWPYLKKLVDNLKSKGALVSIHICGNVSNRLDLLAETGIDILSVDYKVDLSLAKKILGNKVTLAGNLNPVYLAEATPDKIASAAQDCLEKGDQDGKFILMPGCDLPPEVPLENIQALIKSVYSKKRG